MPLLANMAVSQSDNKNNWTDEQVNAKLNEKYEDKANEIVNTFLNAYSYNKKNDALYIDTWLRSHAKKTATLKAD